MTRFTALSLILLGVLPGVAAAVDYQRDVKPLLQRKCYACHGALKQQASLRVDTVASLKTGGDSGPAVAAAADAEESLLLGVLTGVAGFRMPPAKEGAPLKDDEIDLIRQWIADGAPAPKDDRPQADPRGWWSYQPIRNPPPPAGELRRGENPIDRFIAAKRQELGLPHAGPASRETWLRRVTLDLTGLPPKPADVERFLQDASPNAHERVVDRLLASPEYGERWGRHWMDIWRYSDWYGSRGGNEIRYSQRHIWRWRDWIIRSLNDDKGYDQMVREMLAADEIAGHDPDILPATGYLGRNWYKFDRNVWLYETVERTGEAFLGLTLRCCRCHDHKYDPVSQEEYYRFRAFFEPHDVRIDPITAGGEMQKDAKLGQVLSDGVPRVFDKQLDAKTFLFQRGDDRQPDKSRPLAPGAPAALSSAEIEVRPIQLEPLAWYPALREPYRKSFLRQSQLAVENARKELAKLDAEWREAQQAVVRRVAAGEGELAAPSVFLHDTFSGYRPEIWNKPDKNWKYEGGRLIEQNVVSFATLVTKENHPADFSVHLRYRPLAPGSYRSVGFSFDYQDQGNSQDVYTSTGDQSQSVQAFHRVGGKQAYPRAGIVKTKLKVGEEAALDVKVLGDKLTIDLNGERKLDYVLPIARKPGKFALWVHQGAAEFLELKIRKHAETLETVRQREQQKKRAAQLAEFSVQVAEAEALAAAARLEAEQTKYLGDDADRGEETSARAARLQREAKTLSIELEVRRLKGQASTDEQKKQLAAAEKRLADAQAAVESTDTDYEPIGAQFPKTSTGRRTALADWVASPKNPRTARVAANHIWGRHFGRPLVETTENFGLNGRKPTHPQLLDWLATELIRNGWRMKPLHRRIVLSQTYRMSSRSSGLEPAWRMDPENRFLWRWNSRRMEAEVVRDSMLHLAGRLDQRLGGPEIDEKKGETVFRRSLYFRNTPNEKMTMLAVFDVADPNACYRRKESVVPNQSLAMMNSGLTQDCAKLIAANLEDDAQPFIDTAFRLILCRPPTAAEKQRCESFLDEHQSLLAKPVERTFAAGGSAKRSPAADSASRARENLVHVLLLHNDFITVR